MLTIYILFTITLVSLAVLRYMFSNSSTGESYRLLAGFLNSAVGLDGQRRLISELVKNSLNF